MKRVVLKIYEFKLASFQNNKSVKYVRPGECSPEKDCLRWHRLTFRQTERKSSSESLEVINSDLTLMVTSAQVVKLNLQIR